jgi:hypothetical protein
MRTRGQSDRGHRIDSAPAELTAPANFQEFKREARRLIDAMQKHRSNDGEANRKRLAKLDAEIDNLIRAVREVGISPSLRQALTAAEAERDQLRAATAVDDVRDLRRGTLHHQF